MEKENRAFLIHQLKPKKLPEIVFIGRSNVGKSSLINTILNRKATKVSKTPGKTLWLGIHEFNGCCIIDMPGYGYARTSEQRKDAVNTLLEGYFQLRRADLAFVLIDLRHGFRELDLEMIHMISGLVPEIKIIGTKNDAKEAKNFDFDFKTSSKKKLGINEIRDFLANYPATIINSPRSK